MVGPGQVVAHAGRRQHPEEHRPGRLHPGQPRLGIVGEDLQVLGGHDVGDLHGLFGPVHHHRVAAGLQGRLQVGAPGRRRHHPVDLGAHRLGHRLRPGDQPGQSVGAVLGLDHQVDGREFGRGVGAGDDHHLGRAGEGRRHPHHPRHLALGLGHVAVAGADDHVDRLDRLGPVGHGRDGLGPTDPVDLVDAGHRGRGQGGVVDGAVGAGWHAQHHLADPGHPGGGGAHQHGRRIPGPAARRVAAGPGHRADQLGDGDPVGLEAVGGGGPGLVGVVGDDPVMGDVQGIPQGSGDAGGGGLDLRRRHPQLVEPDLVELLGEAAEGAVPLGPHLGDDGGHRLGRPLLLVRRARQRLPQLAAVPGKPANVEAAKQHGRSRLPSGFPPSVDAACRRGGWSGRHPPLRRRTHGRRRTATWATGRQSAMIASWPPAQQSSRHSPPPWRI